MKHSVSFGDALLRRTPQCNLADKITQCGSPIAQIYHHKPNSSKKYSNDQKIHSHRCSKINFPSWFGQNKSAKEAACPMVVMLMIKYCIEGAKKEAVLIENGATQKSSLIGPLTYTGRCDKTMQCLAKHFTGNFELSHRCLGRFQKCLQCCCTHLKTKP